MEFEVVENDDLNIAQLGDLVKIKGGKRLPKGSFLQTISNTHPYIRVRDMGYRYLPKEGLEYVPDDVFPLIKNYIVNENDVIVSIVGSIGFISVIDSKFQNASLTENCVKLSGLDKDDALFLYYFLSSDIGQYEIHKGTIGAVQAKLPLYNIAKLGIYWPEKRQRKAIADILSSVDDKIALNREMNKTLEAMAKAIFKNWFVDFEPVKEGEFVESELGMIPKGWEVGTIGNIIKVADGTHDSPKQQDSGYYLVTSKHMKNNSIDLTQAYFISEEDFASINKRSQVDKYDILISMIGTVGEICPVMIDKINFAIKNIGLFKTSQNTKYFEYILLYLSSSLGKEYIRTHQSGSTQQYLTLKSLREFPILLPNEKSLDIFKFNTQNLFEQVFENQKQIETLSTLRDTLLPKLLSGEIGV